VKGLKLIGSAQARRKEGILQHGAIPLGGDLTRIITALKFEDEAAQTNAKERLLAHATTIERELRRRPSWDEVSKALQKAFTTTLNLNLEAGELTPKETRRAQELMQEKYAHPSWTERI